MNEKELDIKNDFNNLLKATTDEEKIGILYSTMSGEYKYIFEEFANNFIMNAENPLINAHYVHNFCINETLNFFIKVIEQACIDEHDDYFKKAIDRCFERLEQIDNEFKKMAGKIEPSLTIKKIDELREIVENKINDYKYKPQYIKDLMEEGYIAADGITAIASLDVIAEYIHTSGLESFNYKTLLQFRQSNGQPFSDNSAKEAVKRARS